MLSRLKYIAAALVVIAVAAALLIDWRFWYRWHTLPEDAGEWPASYYQPTATLAGAPAPFFPLAGASDRSIDPAALEAAASWAEAHNSAALLVLHRGVVQHEQYWQGIGPDSLFTGRAMTRSLIPPLIAIAMEKGIIGGVDDRIGDYIPEWRDDPRGDITLQQLMENNSGLENAPLAGDPDPNNKNTRLALGGDFRAASLNFGLENTPGEFLAFGNVNSQLLGVVLESATGEDYETLLNDWLWAPLGAGEASLYMDSPGGMPAVYCCYRATPRDWLRYGAALLNDGMVGGQFIDVEATGRELQLDQLRTMHSLKTGALIRASLALGAICAGADEKALRALEEYGQHIGLAFQVVDDILDVEGDPRNLGKTKGKDSEAGKATYVQLMGLDGARAEAHHLRNAALDTLGDFGHAADPLRNLARYIVDRDR